MVAASCSSSITQISNCYQRYHLAVIKRNPRFHNRLKFRMTTSTSILEKTRCKSSKSSSRTYLSKTHPQPTRNSSRALFLILNQCHSGEIKLHLSSRQSTLCPQYNPLLSNHNQLVRNQAKSFLRSFLKVNPKLQVKITQTPRRLKTSSSFEIFHHSSS